MNALSISPFCVKSACIAVTFPPACPILPYVACASASEARELYVRTTGAPDVARSSEMRPPRSVDNVNERINGDYVRTLPPPITMAFSSASAFVVVVFSLEVSCSWKCWNTTRMVHIGPAAREPYRQWC